MTGASFQRIIQDAFVPVLKRIGFHEDATSISGRAYQASFHSSTHVVTASFEPGDEQLFVIVRTQRDGKLSAIDESPRLSTLNNRYMHRISDSEKVSNAEMFWTIKVDDDSERKLLKAAEELSLVLPKCMREHDCQG